jgi:hypothetical protein
MGRLRHIGGRSAIYVADSTGSWMVPRGGLSLKLFNISKINILTPPQMAALYQANVPMSTVK